MIFRKARTGALVGALALFFVIAMIPDALGADRYTWNGPFNVTVDPAQTYGFDPSIVHTTGGTFFALMAGTVNGTGGFYLISSTDGMNWGTPAYVTSGWDESHIIQAQDGYLYASLSKSGGVEIWRGSSSGTGWSYWGQVVSMGGSQQYWSGSLSQAPDAAARATTSIRPSWRSEGPSTWSTTPTITSRSGCPIPPTAGRRGARRGR